ncbi:UBX domain-containing protein 4-like isoform X3 [Acanthaster planci]|uniref:UBX domain-containing protein 4 n=1 Tax=Acanthaster planci TaxID=133434 RepID=A0A8B7Y3H8_ACAPL|nr:UBX domain-containing protein 4-like isoform X3 [Acanthaster planci]
MLWFEGSITAAITTAKQRNVLFVVYVRGDDDVTKMMDSTWEDEEISNLCKDSGMVAVKFDADSDECKQFSQYYPVIYVPCVSFISGETGIPLEGTAGHISPADFKQRIQKVLEMSRQGPASTPKVQAAAQASGSTSRPPAMAPVTTASPQPSPGAQASTTLAQAASSTQIPPASTATSQSQQKELSKLEKAARLRQKMEEIHQRKEAQKEEEIKRKEIERRKVGQAVQKSMTEKADQQARRAAEEIRKEKEESRLAKERVREQIARDRAEKQSRYEANKREKEKTQAAAKETASTANEAPKRKVNMNVARIQFRLPDGSTLMQQFDAKAPLQAAQQYLMENVGGSLREFTMSTTFPRRRFAASDLNSTFLELELVPTAAVIVLPGQFDSVPSTTNSPSVKPSSSGGIIALILAPFLFLWNLIISFIFGQPSKSEKREGDSQVPMQQTAPPAGEYAQSPTGARPKSAQVRRRVPGGDGSVSRQEGNVHRLVTAQDDDDDNNTWNGNSTQQM